MIFITNLSTFLHYYPQNKTIKSIKEEKIYINLTKKQDLYGFFSLFVQNILEKNIQIQRNPIRFQKILRIQENRKKNYKIYS